MNNLNTDIINTKNLCKSFSVGGVQQHVLKNLDMNVKEGEFIVIMGSSGSGKSTLLYALSGMDKPTIGDITFNGVNLCDLNNDKLALFRRKNCGFVFQDVFLNDNMSIMDNVLSVGYLLKTDKKQVISRAKELLTYVGIDSKMYKKFPTQMSGGELQRVGFVRALINAPTVVFADEPTGALNSNSAKNLMDLFNKINIEGKSIVLVTHDIKTAVRGDKIYYLKDGVILSQLELGKYCEDENENRIIKLNEFLMQMGW